MKLGVDVVAAIAFGRSTKNQTETPLAIHIEDLDVSRASFSFPVESTTPNSSPFAWQNPWVLPGKSLSISMRSKCMRMVARKMPGSGAGWTWRCGTACAGRGARPRVAVTAKSGRAWRYSPCNGCRRDPPSSCGCSSRSSRSSSRTSSRSILPTRQNPRGQALRRARGCSPARSHQHPGKPASCPRGAAATASAG